MDMEITASLVIVTILVGSIASILYDSAFLTYQQTKVPVIKKTKKEKSPLLLDYGGYFGAGLRPPTCTLRLKLFDALYEVYVTKHYFDKMFEGQNITIRYALRRISQTMKLRVP